MRNIILLALFCLLAIPVLQARLAAQSVRTPRSNIVRLVDSSGSCTGFVVGPNLVATAGHCTAEGTGGEVQYIDGQSVPYVVIASQYDKWPGLEDWALVSVETGNRPAFRVVPEKAQAGVGIVHQGCPDYVQDQNPVFGIVLAKLPDALIMASPTIDGESGSPVINSSGEAIAIITRSFRPIPVSVASRVDRLWAVLSGMGVQ